MVQLIDPNVTQPLMAWDSHFPSPDGDVDGGDWIMDGGPGLVADATLATAILLCLFTDRRAPDDIELPGGSPDRRGWWGDFVDIDETLGETEMGSLIWIYERTYLNDEIAERIRAAAEESLQPLIEQAAFSRIDVTETHDTLRGWVKLQISAYSKDGELVYDQRFHRLWQQIFTEA